MAETKTARSKGSRSNRSSAPARKRSSSGSATRRRSRNDAGNTVSAVMSKAKLPLVAGGAAIAGVAGGMVLAGRNQKRSRTKALAQTATAIGKTGYKVSELAAEIGRARKALSR